MAPLMTMLSYPNRKPPSVATLAAMTSGARAGAGVEGAFSLLASGRELGAVTLGRLDDRLRRQHKAETVGHPSMPWR
jgi:hypothetical protein